jgi:hypothetical protein
VIPRRDNVTDAIIYRLYVSLRAIGRCKQGRLCPILLLCALVSLLWKLVLWSRR